MHCNIYLALKYPENYVFLCEQHHIDETLCINCVIVCAIHGYINAENLWRSGSRYLHHSTVKYTKFVFLLKMSFFLFFVAHLTPVSHKVSNCHLWQFVQYPVASGRSQRWKLVFKYNFLNFYNVKLCCVFC